MRLIRLPEVIKKVGFGRTTIYEMIKAGDFPAPIKKRNKSLWTEEEVDAWVKALVESARA